MPPGRNKRIHRGWSVDKHQELGASEGIISKDVPITIHQKITGVLLLLLPQLSLLLLHWLFLVLRLVKVQVPLVVLLKIEVVMLI